MREAAIAVGMPVRVLIANRKRRAIGRLYDLGSQLVEWNAIMVPIGEAFQLLRVCRRAGGKPVISPAFISTIKVKARNFH